MCGGEHVQACTGRQGAPSGGGRSLHNVLLQSEVVVKLKNKFICQEMYRGVTFHLESTGIRVSDVFVVLYC